MRAFAPGKWRNTKYRCHDNETHIPTQQPEAGTHTWFQSKDGDESGAPGIETTPGKGAGAALAEALDQAAARNPTEKPPTTGTTADCRFRRQSRLPDSSAYRRVFRNAERSRDKMFTVLYKQNGGGQARLGLAISSKHCRSAVGRNRLKRIVRESFRLHRADLKGLDLVVLNRPASARAGNKALFDSLHQHWQTCGSGGAGQTHNG